MDEISEQLRREIEALESHIERTEDRFLATAWSDQLLNPLERVEAELSPEDLCSVLKVLYAAKSRFKVDGELAARIDEVFRRHSRLYEEIAADSSDHFEVAAAEEFEEALLSPNADPGDSVTESPHGLFEDDNEELEPSSASEPGESSGLEAGGSPVDTTV